jgi:flagellar secretion chaperone FliS
MSLSAYKTSLEAQILSSDPVQLVDILYSLAIDSVEAARSAHQRGDIFSRGRHSTKTFEVLVELQHSLNFEKGGEIARNYARLYDYCQRRVLEGHTAGSEASFAEVASLLQDMKEAWQAVIKHNAANRPVVEADSAQAESTAGIQAGADGDYEAASVGEARFA